MVFFHSVAGRPYSRDWFTSLDIEKEEKRDRSGVCGRELRGSGVIGLGSGAGLPSAHSVLWAWHFTPKGLQSEKEKRA